MITRYDALARIRGEAYWSKNPAIKNIAGNRKYVAIPALRSAIDHAQEHPQKTTWILEAIERIAADQVTRRARSKSHPFQALVTELGAMIDA